MTYSIWKNYVEVTDTCWLWTGALGGDGKYGTFTEYLGDGKTKQHVAHRLLYEYYNEPIPEGCHLHHTCGINRCVTPWHLVPMTPQEHKRLHMSKLTSCKHGHPFDEENTYINPRGQRECKECRRQAVRKWRLGLKEVV